ncbi:redox-sensing transcriptional repressor Rex [Pediococcus argentinicus]|uniref:Redox-sensing transcriptional repressor Rex n=1 Tax=Pediococcus argentinicus TaxID=480391 RepID=A0A0R2NIZ6_9LACO|nr:redox-sensing transcriptional repressor Rex [Pediococcus argentinicus]KRO25761.1 redox-sensing transcriptional repressor Rex [Pediococcus argentinicus]NKZ21927.1 redox-sensing transcriptional repressor Rex [Pediococcus argentinicus]GEP19096.1 redox-sensing transcriptional repressor Rex [Pediococcus argentinicus]
MTDKIPVATTKRLPLYYRFLTELYNRGTLKISSSELADLLKIDSATIRRDFSHFGQMGRRGYGYDVKELLGFFKDILDQDVQTTVALVGVGHLGHALLNFNFHKSSNVRIGVAFDVNPSVIGTKEGEVEVFAMDNLKEQIKLHKTDVAILTVPTDAAQEITDELVEAGISGIMNFTTERLAVPNNISVQNVDLTSELQNLIYAIGHK